MATSAIFNEPPPEFVPTEMDVYAPTRLEYLASMVLQGLVVGRSEKERRNCARESVAIAQELIELVDSAQS